METKTLTVEQVTAAVAEAKVRTLDAARSRMHAIVDLTCGKDYEASARSLVAAICSEVESIIDGAIMSNLPGITLPALQEARRQYFRRRSGCKSTEATETEKTE